MMENVFFGLLIIQKFLYFRIKSKPGKYLGLPHPSYKLVTSKECFAITDRNHA